MSLKTVVMWRMTFSDLPKQLLHKLMMKLVLSSIKILKMSSIFVKTKTKTTFLVSEEPRDQDGKSRDYICGW